MEMPSMKSPPCANLLACHWIKPFQTALPSPNFRHLLEQHELARKNLLSTVNHWLAECGVLMTCGTLVGCHHHSSPSSTKTNTTAVMKIMHQDQKGNQWYFGSESAHWRGRQSGPGPTVWWMTTAANRARTSIRLASYRMAMKNLSQPMLDLSGAEKRDELLAMSAADWLYRQASRQSECIEATPAQEQAGHPLRILESEYPSEG